MSKKILDDECKKENPQKEIVLECLNMKIFPDDKTIKNLLSKSKNNDKIEILECFYHFGYVPSKNDILLMAIYGIESSRFEKSYLDDKEFVSKLDDIFSANMVYLYGIKASLKAFKKFLESSYYGEDSVQIFSFRKKKKCQSLSKVKKFIEDNNIQPDLECLKIVCGLPLSGDVIRYFIEELKIEPDFDCISSCYHADKTIKYLVDKVKNKK